MNGPSPPGGRDPARPGAQISDPLLVATPAGARGLREPRPCARQAAPAAVAVRGCVAPRVVRVPARCDRAGTRPPDPAAYRAFSRRPGRSTGIVHTPGEGLPMLRQRPARGSDRGHRTAGRLRPAHARHHLRARLRGGGLGGSGGLPDPAVGQAAGSSHRVIGPFALGCWAVAGAQRTPAPDSAGSPQCCSAPSPPSAAVPPATCSSARSRASSPTRSSTPPPALQPAARSPSSPASNTPLTAPRAAPSSGRTAPVGDPVRPARAPRPRLVGAASPPRGRGAVAGAGPTRAGRSEVGRDQADAVGSARRWSGVTSTEVRRARIEPLLPDRPSERGDRWGITAR